VRRDEAGRRLEAKPGSGFWGLDYPAHEPFYVPEERLQRHKRRRQTRSHGRVRGYNDPWAHGADRHRLA